MNKAAIIIVNWNGFKHLEVMFNALLNQTINNFEVIFVDNGSTDNSIEFVSRNYPQTTIIENEKNYGFAEANNIGIRHALKKSEIDYIICLNNDTEVKKDWLEKLVSVADNDNTIGACASKLLYFDDREIIDSAGDFYFYDSLKVVPRGHGKKDSYFEQVECLSACAAASLYRREALESTELYGDYFDSDYFAYIEDTDLSLRIRIAGWKIVFVPDAIVYHKVSSTTSQLKLGMKKFFSTKNRLYTIIKIYPISLWLKALKNPVTYSEKGNFSTELKLYFKLLYYLLRISPLAFKKRFFIRKKFRIDKQFFVSLQEKFSLKD